MRLLRILGIDPGSRITGYAVIEGDGVRHMHVTHGFIKTREESFPARLGEIFTGIACVIEEFAPDEVAIEDVFVSKNASSALKLGQARGAAICAAVQAGCSVFEYTPRAVKQSIFGNGSAEKQQVQHMVKIMLNLKEKIQMDASDALGIALTHAHIRSTNLRLQTGTRS
ncbi:MAG: crossover junction endodeoxyribonuclease RuvC [Gammaproteobacteria bacterium]